MIQTRRYDINYHPLQVQVALCQGGSVPLLQTYDMEQAAGEQFVPDYTLAPAVIVPKVALIDKQGSAKYAANAALFNVQWTAATSAQAAPAVLTDCADYGIDSSDTATRGTLTIRRNCPDGLPLTLRFTASVQDPRGSGQVFQVAASILLQCRAATEQPPHLGLDCPQTILHCPILAPAEPLVVRATLQEETGQMPQAQCRYFWDKWDTAAEGWAPISAAEPMDYDTQPSEDGTALTIHRHLIGSALTIRCRAAYTRSSATISPTAAPEEGGPQRTLTILRRYSRYQADFGGVPTQIPPGTEAIHPRAMITTAESVLAHPAHHFHITWHTANNTARPGHDTAEWAEIAQGEQPEIPLAGVAVHPEHGIILGMDIQERAPLGAWQDTDGALLTDNTGAVLVI